MATEVKLRPGWLLHDVRLAASRMETRDPHRSFHDEPHICDQPEIKQVVEPAEVGDESATQPVREC
jgi:hypothetical protein